VLRSNVCEPVREVEHEVEEEKIEPAFCGGEVGPERVNTLVSIVKF
jgi:hypothetical protein